MNQTEQHHEGILDMKWSKKILILLKCEFASV